MDDVTLTNVNNDLISRPADTTKHASQRNCKGFDFHKNKIDETIIHSPSPGHSALISLRGVSKCFASAGSTIDVLDAVDFDIREGERVAVVGASGSGKSTLLHIMGTLDRPDSGRLMFRDQDLLTLPSDDLACFRNRRIGFVFQFHHLLRGFSAAENVSIPCRIQKMSSQRCKIISHEMLERVGLKDRIHHRAEDLSGGEQQRVALARALVLKPDILLADEPTGNLDIKNSDGVHQLLVELNRELKMTVMVVTHNRALADLMKRKVTIEGARVVEVV